jgi:general secretion pathway protein K
VLVLGALVILTVFATELQERTASTMAATMADRDGLKAEYYARSSINLTRLLISTEPIVRKAIDPLAQAALKRPLSQIAVWEYTELVLAPFNDAA